MKKHIRREIRYIISDENTPLPDREEFRNLIDSNQSPVTRIFYLIVIVSCTSICCYQLQERIKWYFTYPVAVDVGVFQRNSIENTVEFETCLILGNEVSKTDVKTQERHMLYDKNKRGVLVINKTNTDIQGNQFVADNVQVIYTISEAGFCGLIKINYQIEKSMYSTDLYLNLTPGLSMKLFDGRNWISERLFQSMKISVWYLHIRQYEFYNTPSKPCLTQNEYRQCRKKCMMRKIMQSRYQCRVFTNSDEIKLPPCDCTTNKSLCAGKNFDDYGAFYDIRCECKDTCKRFQFLSSDEKLPITHDPLLFHLITNDIVLRMSEKRIYTAIHLSIDFGGSIGLFLGLALLQIVNNCYIAILLVKRKILQYKRQRSQFRTILMKMFKKYQCMKSNIDADVKNISGKNADGMLTYLKKAVWIGCMCVAIFMIQDQIGYYFSHPVRSIVKIETKLFAIFPSTTICGPSPSIINLTKVVAAQRNSSDWSKIDMLDLLDGIQDITVDDIWRKSLPLFKYDNCFILANTSTLTTHEGNCYFFTFEKEMKMLMPCLIPFERPVANDEFFSKSYFKTFTDDFEIDSYSIISQVAAEATISVAIDYYNLQKVIHINRKLNPCVDNAGFKECARKCIEQLHQEADICQLPFMPNADLNKPCINSVEAKQSRETSMKIFAKVALGNSCKCVRSCIENIALKKIDKTSYNFFSLELEMSSNIIENIVEVNVYTFIALCCDVGNILGFALGMSVLDILGYSRYTVNVFNIVFLKKKVPSELTN